MNQNKTVLTRWNEKCYVSVWECSWAFWRFSLDLKTHNNKLANSYLAARNSCFMRGQMTVFIKRSLVVLERVIRCLQLPVEKGCLSARWSAGNILIILHSLKVVRMFLSTPVGYTCCFCNTLTADECNPERLCSNVGQGDFKSHPLWMSLPHLREGSI